MNRAIAAATAVLLGAGLMGCAPTSAALPTTVEVSVFETRSDAALRQVQLRVTNGSGEALTVIRAELQSSRFAAPAAFDRSQTVPAGGIRDLPVRLGDAVCSDDVVADAVVLEFLLADGATGTQVLPLTDTAIIDAINARDCLMVAVEVHARITPPETIDWVPGSETPAVLEFTVMPTGADGSLTIVDAGNTTLLGMVGSDGSRATPLPLNVVVDESSAPSVIRLLIEPARCDPHAVAEDKQGTHFPFTVVTSDGPAGQIQIPVGDAVRAEIYEFFGDFCGLP